MKLSWALLLAFSVLDAALAPAQPMLVPRPLSEAPSAGAFELSGEINVVAGDPALRATADWLITALGNTPARTLKLATERGGAAAIALQINRTDAAISPDSEAYELSIAPREVTISAAAPAGIARGIATLLQLADTAAVASSSTLPALHVRDEPRYRWRGMLLDCGRHFMPLDVVKKYIDLLAYHKLNVLHWHLTEDQGWRLEVRSHPRLTEVGAWREATRDSEQPRDRDGRYGGFYTQEEVRGIVAYAAARHVLVVPEIELPGHAQAALAAYPQLSCAGGPFSVSTKWGVHDDVFCAGNDDAFKLLEDVLSEVVELFPSPYIHIGGDEVPKTRWKACPKCQARMKSLGLKNEDELQSYFIRRVADFLKAKNRRIIGWDEILDGGAPRGAVIQSWRGFEGAIAAARSGHEVIVSPTSHCYLDYAQVRGTGEPEFMGYLPLEEVFRFEPMPRVHGTGDAARILGGQGNLWTEHIPASRLDYQAFPRLCAIAEILWSPATPRDFDEFRKRLEIHLKRLDARGVKYYRGPVAP
ncbi:MAG: beta-N-acetylhexosaminidase [Planctomycetota bacterium]